MHGHGKVKDTKRMGQLSHARCKCVIISTYILLHVLWIKLSNGDDQRGFHLIASL